ncbi:hypothetical protein AMJ49_06000 [Parcubacteria bacterium DG_74_2]|nr:MAG: hypothetical protein AMJ49_06000 [Parcubacteria bacterium DG_74_2]
MVKLKEKEKAIKLRKKGHSYSQILEKIPVAKSTLSLWLRSVKLAKRQKQQLTQKKLAAAFRGAMKRREQRIDITKKIKNKARNEIGNISNRELWLIGIALYWGEGDKEKEKSSLVALGNSDPYLIKIFLEWLQKICKIPKSEIHFRIYLHLIAKNKLKETQKYWSNITGFPIKDFQKITWKKHKINTNRKNIGKNYFGLLKVTVRKSINLNRKIAGWTEGICKKYNNKR